jgi:hypothetical protein
MMNKENSEKPLNPIDYYDAKIHTQEKKNKNTLFSFLNMTPIT